MEALRIANRQAWCHFVVLVESCECPVTTRHHWTGRENGAPPHTQHITPSHKTHSTFSPAQVALQAQRNIESMKILPKNAFSFSLSDFVV